MNPLDIAILILVGVIGIKGFSRGFVRGTTDLIGWLAAMVIAGRYAPVVAQYLSGTAMAPAANGAAFSITFMVALGVIGIATGIFFKITGIVVPKIPPFGFINRTLGIVPGVVKGAMIASVVLAPILAWDGLLGAESPVSDSVLARPVVESVNRLTSGALVRAGVDPAAATGVMAQP